MKSRILILFFTSILLFSCNSEKHLARMQAKYCEPYASTDSTIHIQHDTVVTERIEFVKIAPQPDTLLIKALAYCDSLNHVQMQAVNIKTDKHRAIIEIVDNNLKATIICNTDSLTEIIRFKDTRIRFLEHRNTRARQNLYVENSKGKFYKYFFWSFVLVVSVAIAIFLLRWYFTRF